MKNKHIKPSHIAVKVVNLSQPADPQESTRRSDSNASWIKFFNNDGNAFPNELAERALRSSTHNAIIQNKMVYCMGQGFYLWDKKNNKELAVEDNKDFYNYFYSINANNESFEDIYKRCIYDYLLTGNFAVEIAKKDKILNIYHKDITTVRKGKPENNIIKKYFLSYDWKAIGSGIEAKGEQEIKEISSYYPAIKNGNSLIFYSNYSPRYRYYGVPDYMGALAWIDIEYKIPKYNLDRFANGFMPSGIMTFYGQPPDGNTAESYLQDIVDNMTGEGNNGKIVFSMQDSKDNDPFVHLFEQVKEGDFRMLQELAVYNIISAHGWHPALAGIQIAGKLGEGSGKEMRTAFELRLFTKIKEYQKNVLSVFNKLFTDVGFIGYELMVKNNFPIGFSDTITLDSILKVNEARESIGLEYDENIKEKYITEINKQYGGNSFNNGK